MEELNTPIFAQAKIEYTKQLIEILYPHIFDGIKSIYDESKIIYSTKTGTPILLLFRELLERVPIWNGEIIDSECSRIINNSKCDWIDDLITAVFISHTKILTSIGPNQSFQKINVTIPKTSSFIHKCYINVARELWKNPYLLNESVPGHEYQRNSKEIENIIKYCVENTVRHLLPIKEILKEHLDNENDNLLNQKEELKKLLREELKDLKELKYLKDTDKDKDKEIADEDANDVDEDSNDAEEVIDDSLLRDPPKEEDTGPTIVKEEDEETIEQSVTDQDTSEEKPEEKSEDKSDEDLLPDIKRELEKIIAEEKEFPLITPDLSEVEPVPEPEPTEEPSFSSNDDPTEAQVVKQCSDIVVNDITIPVEIPGEKKEEDKLGTEMKYDNVDIVSTSEEEDKKKLAKMNKLMQSKDLIEVNVVKSNEISTSPQNDVPAPQLPSQPVIPQAEPAKPAFSLNNLYPNMTATPPSPQPAPQPAPQPELKPNLSLSKIPETEIKVQTVQSADPNVTQTGGTTSQSPEEPKSPRKEQVSVDNDIDETSSLANFFQDMKDIAVKKGIQIEPNKENKFTLFEDAPEVEKIGA